MTWLAEYPRPQLKRDSFFPLNGTWQLNGKPIEVPFPPESRLSGYTGENDGHLTYTRTFVLPEGFAAPGQRVRLHFGAVDQIADVELNGHHVIHHEGGYLPFYADISGFLCPGVNTLTVRATDTLSHDYPYGKQSKDRGGMWYTPVSGIWQTVWMEALPEKPIESLRVIPDMKGITLTIETRADECIIEIPGVCVISAKPNQPVRINIPDPSLWTPDNPHLYNLSVRTNTDCVESYFALRTVEIRMHNGRQRLLLNGRPLFMNGVLDQGYFEDGLYLPATPDGYAADILRMKELGINLLRKHIKIEPEAFYHACDRLGMLVMQDMVNTGSYSFIRDTALPTIGLTRRSDSCRNPASVPAKAFFTQHALDTVAHLHNHPSIIAYTIFNEGWGQFNADAHYELLRDADPTRVYDSTSGWFTRKKSDFDSIHVYFRNKHLKCGIRPLLLSECGGYARPISGHMFNPRGKYGYGTAETEEALTAKIEHMWNTMVLPAIPDGLCGVIYTQLSDVEDEINGLYTYDRQVCKVTPNRLRALAEKAAQLTEIQP